MSDAELERKSLANFEKNTHIKRSKKIQNNNDGNFNKPYLLYFVTNTVSVIVINCMDSRYR